MVAAGDAPIVGHRGEIIRRAVAIAVAQPRDFGALDHEDFVLRGSDDAEGLVKSGGETPPAMAVRRARPDITAAGRHHERARRGERHTRQLADHLARQSNRFDAVRRGLQRRQRKVDLQGGAGGNLDAFQRLLVVGSGGPQLIGAGRHVQTVAAVGPDLLDDLVILATDERRALDANLRESHGCVRPRLPHAAGDATHRGRGGLDTREERERHRRGESEYREPRMHHGGTAAPRRRTVILKTPESAAVNATAFPSRTAPSTLTSERDCSSRFSHRGA